MGVDYLDFNTRYGGFKIPTELVDAFEAAYQGLLEGGPEDDFFHFWGIN